MNVCFLKVEVWGRGTCFVKDISRSYINLNKCSSVRHFLLKSKCTYVRKQKCISPAPSH